MQVVPHEERRALLPHAADHAAADGLPTLTLTTFAHVSWNVPYYARCGFRILDDGEITPGLRAIRPSYPLVLGTQAFPADAAGYQAALAWMRAHGELAKVGVEGTGSYGAGLARYLAACGVEVAGVMRPNRQARRQRGKSDTADAVAAAVAALSGEASGMPKSRDGAAESIRALKVARAGSVKARTQAGNQLRDLILTAPEPLRQQLAGQPPGRQAGVAARFRPGAPACPAEGAKAAMASVARRHQQLTAEITRLDTMLEELVRHAAPEGFLAKRGVATQVAAALLVTAGDNPGRVRREASFAALCGASPVDASSGKQLRHRLNRGGGRQANSAL